MLRSTTTGQRSTDIVLSKTRIDRRPKTLALSETKTQSRSLRSLAATTTDPPQPWALLSDSRVCPQVCFVLYTTRRRSKPLDGQARGQVSLRLIGGRCLYSSNHSHELTVSLGNLVLHMPTWALPLQLTEAGLRVLEKKPAVVQRLFQWVGIWCVHTHYVALSDTMQERWDLRRARGRGYRHVRVPGA